MVKAGLGNKYMTSYRISADGGGERGQNSQLNFALIVQITKQMGGVVKGLDKVVQSMDLEKVCLLWFGLHHHHTSPIPLSSRFPPP